MRSIVYVFEDFAGFMRVVRLHKQYLKALEKYDEIEDEDKRDVFNGTI
jgi:hypothetical protein